LQKTVSFLELIGRGRIPEVIVGTWIVMALLLVFGFLARAALAAVADPTIPDEGITLRSVAEVLVEWVDGFVAGVMDSHDYRELVPFLGSLFLFIVASNFFGLIPGIEPPTSFSDLTFALGTICFFYYVYHGFKRNGLHYLRSFLGPLLVLSPIMLPIEVADNLFRPFSLGLRLAANMFADHQVLHLFTGLTKLFVPLAFYALATIVCLIQALIFMVLTMSYVKLAQSHEH
jgi:F-type H+-transporting ATPase subunit a